MEIAPDKEHCVADTSAKGRQISEEKAQAGGQFSETTLMSPAVVQTFIDARQTFDVVRDVTPTGTALASDNLHKHETHSSCKFKCGRKKVPLQEGGRSYSLRSADAGASRSKSSDTSKPPEDVNAVLSQSFAMKKRRRKKKDENSRSVDEISRIRNRVKGIISRMHYEQCLIEAYSGEGWNRQSQDKVKPEKEIKRAAAEILKCKRKIRDSFKDLEFLCAEGKHQDSLFDFEGQIHSEDIFCAKCLSKDLSIDNDIILCDGVCDRGFHQLCLEPPLLKEQIPPGDEAWFCPGCSCKLDLITSLNQYQGANLSIEDNWERIFPEVAVQADGAQQTDDLGLPSDDSEDTDFDPENPDPVNSEKEETSSDESDFTSDSSGPSSGRASFVKAESFNSSGSSKVASQSSEDSKGSKERETAAIGEVMSTVSSGRRQLERLDYKKLYDEAYGGLSSSSSGDDDYDDTTSLEDVEVGPSGKDTCQDDQKLRDVENAKQFKMSERKPLKKCMLSYEYSLSGVPAKATQNCQKKRMRQQLEVGGDKVQVVAWTPRPSKFMPDAHKRLYESFRKNQYPTRQTKEELANELGMEFKQVNKWFEHARRRCVKGAVSGRSNANVNAFSHLDDSAQSMADKDGNRERKAGVTISAQDEADNRDIDDQMAARQLIIE